jgi:hypothetical protein
VERSAVCFPMTAAADHNRPPFVISTGAQRSGEICGVLSMTAAADHNRPTLCHLDRSAAKWRDLRCVCP